MRAVLTIALLALLLFACGGETVPGTAQAPDQASGPVVTTEGGTVSDSPSVRSAPAASYTEKLQLLLDKNAKVKSYSFYYIDSTTQLQADQWFVKGNQALVRLYEPNYWNRDEWVDTVYRDFAAGKAVGYCENWQQVRCTDNNRPFPIVFGTFEKKLPIYWITQIPGSAQVIGSETIDERFVTKVVWEDGGKSYTMWMDNTFGLPMKVRIEGGREPEEYYYKDISINSVRDEMLGHQFVKRG